MRRLLLALVCVGLAGCFDSRWTTGAEPQRAAARKLTPKLTTGPSPERKLVHSFRVRAHVSSAYAAEGGDWRKRFQQALDDANAVLSRELSGRLVLAEAQGWRPQQEDALDPLLEELAAHDAGDDVDWVVGLVGSTPRLEMSLHELGAAQPFGKHIVMRAPNSAAEWAHIEQAFSKLDESERQRLHETRKRHKAAMLLLHEPGHTLGAIPVKSPKAIMSRAYSDDVVGFSAPTLALLRVGIAHKKVPDAERDQRGLARALVDVLERHRDADFVESERAFTETLLRKASPARPAPRPPAAPAAPAAPLPTGANARLQRAERELADGDAESAWQTAEPLFAAYPDDPAVQDLRCRIATRRGGDYATVKRECQRALELTPQAPAFR